MNTKDILEIIDANRLNNEQVSLPFISEENGQYLTVFTFDSYDDSEDSMKITTVFRRFVFDLRDFSFKVDVINDETPKEVKFDQLYDIDELDDLYNEYYEKLTKYLKCEISYDELMNSFKKLTSDSYLEVYKQIAAEEVQQETIEEDSEAEEENNEEVKSTSN